MCVCVCVWSLLIGDVSGGGSRDAVVSLCTDLLKHETHRGLIT